MPAIRDAMKSTELPRGVIATIGNYDGIHIGQQSVLDMVTGRAREVGVPSAVITFDPHPLSVVRPEEAPPRLVTQDQKEALLAAAGVDYVLTIRFSHEFSNTRARTFVRDFLHGRLAVSELYVGSNFTFGRRREGNMALLREMGESCGFAAVEIDEVRSGGERVSSSRIRRLVVGGRIAEANDLLGRPYTMTGAIARGDRMGQRLGWPTINLAPESELYPHNGVYVTKVYFPQLRGDLPVGDEHRHPADRVRELPAGHREPHPRLLERCVRRARGRVLLPAPAGGKAVLVDDGPFRPDRA